MEWSTSPAMILLATVASALFFFLFMVLLPAFIMRAILGGKRDMPLRKPLRGAIVCVLAGGAAMYLAIMELGHRQDYWVGWGLIFYVVGVVVATPILAIIFRFRWKQTYGLTAVCLVCQILPLILIASSLIPMLSFVDGLTYFYLASIVILLLTLIIPRRAIPEKTP